MSGEAKDESGDGALIVEYSIGSSSYSMAIVRYNDRVHAVCEILTVSSVQFLVGYSIKGKYDVACVSSSFLIFTSSQDT